MQASAQRETGAGGRSAPRTAFETRIEAATLLIDALAEYMPAGERRSQCADAIKEHLLGPALLEMEARATPQAPTLRPWCRVLICAALVAVLFYVEGALSLVGACHGAGIPAPHRWPF